MRRAALLVCAMVTALVVATGVALAAAQNKTEGSTDAIGKVPLRGGEPSTDYVPGEVAVRTDDGKYEIRKVDAQKLDAVEKAAEEIEATDPSVEETSANYIYKVNGFVPNDEYFYAQNWLRTIWAPEAWDYSKGGDRGVRIGVVDTGWQRDHPDLKNKVAGERDFVVPGDNPMAVDPEAEAEGADYHGTSVAGVAAAETNNNQEGVASVGFNARFVMAKACGPTGCESVDTAQAIDWLAQQQGVKIINLSFGQVYPPGTTDSLLGGAIQRAQEAGALVVASAGNMPPYPGVYTDNYYPACFPGVLGVGSVNEVGTGKAYFSNTGPCVDLVAPGQRVLTTLAKSEAYPYEYAYVSGTSFSAPQVAGTAALIKANNRNFDAKDIANRLQEQAMDRGKPGWDDFYGYGLLDAECSVNPNDSDC